MSFADWRDITRERAKEIITKFETDTYEKEGVRGGEYLFNWCEEYKNFISECVNGCVSSEVDYILKKSYEDSDTPLSYEDIDLFDMDKAREHILYNYEDNKEELKEYANDKESFNRKVKNKSDFEVFLNSLDKEELQEMFNKFDFLERSEAEGEVYEWWIISDPLKYRLEQEGEIFLKGGCVEFWGRQTTGQSISLDSCCLHAFINYLKDVVIR